MKPKKVNLLDSHETKKKYTGKYLVRDLFHDIEVEEGFLFFLDCQRIVGNPIYIHNSDHQRFV